MRHEYETTGLRERDVSPDPISQFERWLQEATAAQIDEPNAMVLSTVDTAGVPFGRHVLLKGISDGGLEFYTNYSSSKGEHISNNRNVALTFPWLALHRQVCITGTAAMLSAAESDEYFALRPRGSQIGAWASEQSSVIEDREALEASEAAMSVRFPSAVPRPPHWGGYRVMPTTVEFWQGRPSRLHDRIRYSRDTSGWTIDRLSP